MDSRHSASANIAIMPTSLVAHMPNMRLFKSKNTGLEVYLRKLLFSRGFRYKLHDKPLPGTPDLVFPRYNAVVFIHGCFWHHHDGCKIAHIPKSNPEFWVEKFRRNNKRHYEACVALGEKGWRHLTVWECAINSPVYFTIDDLLDYIECWLISGAASGELSGMAELPILDLGIGKKG